MIAKLYWHGLLNPSNENTQYFGILKCKLVTNLYSHVKQWGVVNKKSNILAISYYIDVCVCVCVCVCACDDLRQK